MVIHISIVQFEPTMDRVCVTLNNNKEYLISPNILKDINWEYELEEAVIDDNTGELIDILQSSQIKRKVNVCNISLTTAQKVNEHNGVMIYSQLLVFSDKQTVIIVYDNNEMVRRCNTTKNIINKKFEIILNINEKYIPYLAPHSYSMSPNLFGYYELVYFEKEDVENGSI